MPHAVRKPLTPTIEDTSADPGVSKQGKQDTSQMCISLKRKRGYL